MKQRSEPCLCGDPECSRCFPGRVAHDETEYMRREAEAYEQSDNPDFEQEEDDQ